DGAKPWKTKKGLRVYGNASLDSLNHRYSYNRAESRHETRLKKITVEAPASSANLGPGFDVFALALARPRDRITLRSEKSERLTVGIRQVSGTTIPVTA